MQDVPSPELRSWLGTFVVEAAGPEMTERFVEHVDAGILERVPEIAADATLVEDLHRSTRAQWLAWVSMLEDPRYQLHLPHAAGDLARSLARRGEDLGVLLAVYRAAHPVVFAFVAGITDDLPEDGPSTDEVLKYFWLRAGRWMDDSVESLIATYSTEREEVAEARWARRAETIDALVRDPDTVSADDATRILEHPVAQWQTALVLWSAESGEEHLDELHRIADACAVGLGAPRPLVRRAGSRELWCWLATPTEPDPAALSAAAADLAGGSHAAVGTPARGADGFRGSHLEARATQRLALAAVQPPTVLSYREVELLCLAFDNAVLLRRMVARELGELGAADKNLALVRETALVFLTNRLNVEAAANELFVHKNTVRYRLAKAEELLGHPLTERAGLVELALRYVALFGMP